MRVSADVSATPIEISVVDGIVTLLGYVDDELVARRAAPAALAVQGVRAVVDPAPDDCVERQYEPRLSEQELTTTIADALRLDPRVGSRDIQSLSRTGVVTLAGSVAVASARTAAADDAANTLGVRSVQHELRIGRPCDFGPSPCADER